MTKKNHFEKSHNVENCVKGGTLWAFRKSGLLQNIKKIEEGPFGDIKKLSEKNEK